MTDFQQETRRSVVATAVFVEGGLALLAVVLGWVFGLRPLAQIEWTLGGMVLGLAAAAPMVLGLVLASRFPLGPFAELEDIVRRAIVPVFRCCTLLDLVVICALAGLGEELLFRGVAQVGFERLTGSTWLALAAASVLFGLAHPITRSYAVLAAAIGLYLGWLLVASGNLLVPIVTHAAYDLGALLYLLHGAEAAGAEAAGAGAPAPEAYGDDWSI